MKKQKKKSLQIVKRIVTLFLILAITSTQIEPSVFAASSDGQWASESLKEDAVTENKSADATADSTETTNTDESHTDESETAKKPETTDGTAQDPGNTDNTDGTAQNPGNTGTTDGSTQNPGNTDTADKTEQNPDNTDTTDKTEQDSDNTDNTDKTEQDPDNTDDTDKTAQDPETVVTEEQPTEEPDENLSAADAVLPVEISYYLPKFQELKIEAPEEYTDTEQQEEARAAVTDQAMADETTQKLLEQAEKDAESADADESMVDTQALTESAVSEEEYVSYTQMAVTGDTLAAPAVSLPDDVQLDPEADPEDTDPLIGWQVAKLAGIVLSYADGTEINEGDVIPADQINEVSATAVDDGIALMSINASALAKLIALTQDMTVVQRVGAGKNGKWSILVQGGTNQTDTKGTVRHAYGTLANALDAISKDTSSASFKITLLDDYTADTADINALGTSDRTGGKLGKRTTNRPTIIFTGAVNYDISTSYQSWNTLTFPNSSYVYFSGYDPYFTHINVDGTGLEFYGNQNDTSFVEVKFLSAVTAINGGGYNSNNSSKNYSLTLEKIETTVSTPIKRIYGGTYDNAVGDIKLNVKDSVIYGNIYGSGKPYNTTAQTGNVSVNMENVSICKYDSTKNILNAENAGGAFWGAKGNVNGNVTVNISGNYLAESGTWFVSADKSITGNAKLIFENITARTVNNIGSYSASGKVSGTRYISISKNPNSVYDRILVCNVFGWDDMKLSDCSVASELNFGHVQYNSSYTNYMEAVNEVNNNTTPKRNAPRSSYKPDLSTRGDLSIYRCDLNSVSDSYDGYWFRQYYARITSYTYNNSLRVFSGTNASSTNGMSTNAIHIYNMYLSGNDNYKVSIDAAASLPAGTSADARGCIYMENIPYDVNLLYRVFTSATGDTFAIKEKLIRVYNTKARRISLYSGDTTSGTALAQYNTLSEIIKELNNKSAGTYTIALRASYILSDADVTAFNNASGAGKNVIITMITDNGWIAGGQISAGDTASQSYRWSRIYPTFDSLTWKNFTIRGDADQSDGAYKFYANGHNLTINNCNFGSRYGIVSIDAGGSSSSGFGSSDFTVSLFNCFGIHTVFANGVYGTTMKAGVTTIKLDSCVGYTASGNPSADPITVDPANSGVVNTLQVTIKNCDAKVKPSNPGVANKIKGNYWLSVENSQICFQTPYITRNAGTTLSGTTVITDTCEGSRNRSLLTDTIDINGTVRTSSEKDIYLKDFSRINVNQNASLKLGDHAVGVVGGIGAGTSGRMAHVWLDDKSTLNLDWLPENASLRTIKSFGKLCGNDAELDINYDYDKARNGRPLIVQGDYSGDTLKIATTLQPKHKGTVEYPLLQFNSAANAKLDDYTWIADQRYYLKVGDSNSSQIVLRKDEYAPQVYQLKSSGVSLNGTDGLMACIDIYLRDPDRDAIDKKGSTLNDASNGAYPVGVQVYLSSQDVQKKDGVYDYVYNIENGDKQLTKNNPSAVSSYTELNAGTSFTDINGQTITSTSESPIIHIRTAQLIFYSNKNYFIYARDIAGNWSKFLLDTKGPKLNKETWEQTLSYIDKAATTQETNAMYYVDAEYEDVQQSAVNDGTSDINNIGYFANATKYINANKNYAEVRWNTSDKNPWDSFNPEKSTEVTRDSDGKYRLRAKSADLGYAYSELKTLYVFVQDGYGNISKYEFMPVVYDASRNKDGSTGYFSGFGSFAHTICLKGEKAKVPSDPRLKNTAAFKYWYDALDSAKKAVDLSTTLINKPTKFYPMWKNPVFTITQKVKGDGVNKEQSYEYIVTILEEQYKNPIANTTIECVPGTVSGSDASAPTITQITTDAKGEAILFLKPNQTIQLKVERLKYGINVYPMNLPVFDMKQETGGGYSISSNLLINETSNGLIFTHMQNIVVTGISDGLNSRTLPIVGLAAAVVMLGASALMLKRRRRS